jgi:hypothetical protein
MTTTTIEALIRGLINLEDNAVCAALADALEEESDPRLGDVKHLARVEPVIPIRVGAAPWEGRRSSRHGGSPRGRPMACGVWWSISWIRRGVVGEVYPGTVQAERFRPLIPDGYLFHGEPNLPRRAFEAVRRRLLAAALGILLWYDKHGELVVRPEGSVAEALEA